MASVKKVALILLILAVAASVTVAVDAKHNKLNGINKWCEPATNWQLCNQMVRNATTLHEAANNAITYAIAVARRIQGLVPILVETISSDTYLPKNVADDLIKTCTEAFQGSLDDLVEALKYYNSGDVNSADSSMSSAIRTECTDALKVEGENVPLLAKLDTQFYRAVDNALAVAFQRYAGSMWGGSNVAPSPQ